MNFDFKETFLIFIRGILMGSADIVPGVSGGTIALITGIYAHLVGAISKIHFGFLKPLLKLDFASFWNELLDEIDFKFFIPLGLGIAIAVLLLSKLINYCMEAYATLTFSFFLGLIIASAYLLFKKLNHITIKNILFAILGFILAYIFVSINPIATNHSLPVIFISGLIAVCAMILPGISGSFLLLMLGQYKYMMNALHEVHITEIIVFLVGAVIGILGFSKILNFLLENHEEITMAFLIGIMIGTLKIPGSVITSSVDGIFSIVTCLIVIIIAFLLIFVLETRLD